MNHQYNYLLDQYGSQLADLEAAIQTHGDGKDRYHRILKDVDDDLFYYLAEQGHALPPNIAELVPSWPPEEVRRQSTADTSRMMSILEAISFWNSVKRNTLQISARQIDSLRVADYGAGWGRIARFACRDVPESEFLAFEPNPTFVEYYRSCRLPGSVVQTDWPSNVSLAEHGAFQVVYCFSILTHASDRLTHNIRDRWTEITDSGALIFATVRPRFFLEGGVGDASYFKGASVSSLMLEYDQGELLYRPYSDASPDWGVTVMGPRYLERVFGSAFEVLGFRPIATTSNQMIVILRRK